MRILVDTNILLDVLLEREEFLPEAMEIWLANEQGLFESYISAMTPVNIYYVARKILQDKNAARDLVSQILNLFEICALTKSERQSALSLPFADYEDALQTANALAENLDGIVTRNKNDFAKATLPVYDPSEFLKLIKV